MRIKNSTINNNDDDDDDDDDDGDGDSGGGGGGDDDDDDDDYDNNNKQQQQQQIVRPPLRVLLDVSIIPSCWLIYMVLFFIFYKNHTPFDGTKQQGSNETYGRNGRSGGEAGAA